MYVQGGNMEELVAYSVALVLAYLVWHWRGRRVDRTPRLPALKVSNDLTPIDPLVIRGGRSKSWL
jgi:hypothetical protein